MTDELEPKDRIIVDLDVSNLTAAEFIIRDLVRHVGCFRIPLRLHSTVGGPAAVRLINSLGGKAFYSGKFHDTPPNVGMAAKEVARMGVKMFDVHASSGSKALKAAVRNKGDSLVFAVTLFPMLSGEEETIYGSSGIDKVCQFALMAKDAGCDGIICSPKDFEWVCYNRMLESLAKAVSGVFPKWAWGNRKGLLTPGEAIKAGATYVILDASIMNPPKDMGTPAHAAELIAEEISFALEHKEK
ncbi:MAG: orotidine 5'-phosphate decarboxylase [Candidatus Pacebacteria bacterium]|nr:orotidine 5'-phosphate decarboxylase [Candidatus Paceibacterota bacterium]